MAKKLRENASEGKIAILSRLNIFPKNPKYTTNITVKTRQDLSRIILPFTTKNNDVIAARNAKNQKFT